MPSKPAPVEREVASPGLIHPKRPTRSKDALQAHSTAPHHRNAPRDRRRAALVLSFPAHVARLRARLDAELLDENPDQTAGARAWGEGRAS